MDEEKVQRGWFWVLNGMALAAFILVSVNIYLFLGNREVQVENNARQGFINQSIRFSRLNTQLIQALATLSAKTNDIQIRNLLSAHGVTYTVNPTPPAAPSATGGEKQAPAK